MKKDHSDECINHYIPKKIQKIKGNYDKSQFIEECENLMNSSNIYDWKLFKEEFKKIYNSKLYNFSLNDNMLSNIIFKWNALSENFKNTTVLKNKYDKYGRLILKEFRSIYILGEEKKKGMFLDYIILANDENINRIQKAEHIFIDGKFNHPSHYKQLFIIMYKDLIIELKIPAFYILINGKKKIFYDYIFQSVYNILTENKKLDIKFRIITTNSEEALIKSFKIYFPNSLRISCYFHYIQDIIRNIKKYGLYKK